MQQIGFSKVRIAAVGEKEEQEELIEELKEVGIANVGYADSKIEMTEEELIKNMLLGERR